MWVRAVAVALAVGCLVVGAQAAQYSEVWNPPETRHAPRREKAHAPAGKKVAGKGAGVAGKNKPHKHAPKQVPHAGHKAAPGAGHKTAAHAGHPAKTRAKVVAKGASKKSLKMAQSKGAHVHAAAHPKVQNMAGRRAVAHTGSGMASTSAKPAVTPAATRGATQAATSAPVQSVPAMNNVAAQPAASGGNLPPILH